MERQQIIEILERIESPENSWRQPFYDVFRIREGEEKYCLIHKELDFVIKLNKREDSDSCEREAKAYQSGAEYRIQQVLLPCILYHTNQHGIKFYSQPKIHKVSNDLNRFEAQRLEHIGRSLSTKKLMAIEQSLYRDKDIDTTWLRMVYILYGRKFLQSLAEWININQVNDLHRNNLGFVKQKPVIMDYSGYHG